MSKRRAEKGASRQRKDDYKGYWLDRESRSPYWYRFHYNSETGSVERASLAETDRGVALKKLIAYVDNLPVAALDPATEKRTDPESVNVHALLNWYYESHVTTLPKPKSILQSLDLWKEYFDNETVVADLRVKRIEAFTTWLAGKNHSLGYMSRTLRLGKAAFNRAVNFELLDRAPQIKDCQTQEDRESVEPLGRPLELDELVRLFLAKPPSMSRISW